MSALRLQFFLRGPFFLLFKHDISFEQPHIKGIIQISADAIFAFVVPPSLPPDRWLTLCEPQMFLKYPPQKKKIKP